MTSPKGIKFKRRDESLSPIHIDFNTILASPSHIQSFEDNEEYNSRIRAHQNSRIIQFKEQMDKKKIKNSKNKSYLDDNLALHSIEESFHSTINNASWVKNSNCLPVSIYRAFTETSTSENQDNQYQESFLQKKPLGDQNFLPYEKLKYKKNLSMIDPQISSVQLKENLLMGDPQIERIQLKDAIKSLQSPHIFQRFQQQQSYQQQQQQSQELIPSNKISTNTCFNFQNHQTQERSQEHSELSQTQFFQSSGYIPPNQVHLMAKIALSRSRHLHEKEALFKISRGIRNSQLEKVFPQSINRRISSLSTKQKRNSSLNVRKIEINRSLKMNNLHEFPQDSSPSSKYQTNSNKSKQFNQSYFEKESSLSFHDLKPWESKDKCNYQNENISQFGDQYEDNN